jgi:hypothetical protein
MPGKSQALMGTGFLCLLISVFTTPGHGQDPRQARGGRGQVALPDRPGKEEIQMLLTGAASTTRVRGFPAMSSPDR